MNIHRKIDSMDYETGEKEKTTIVEIKEHISDSFDADEQEVDYRGWLEVDQMTIWDAMRHYDKKVFTSGQYNDVMIGRKLYTNDQLSEQSIAIAIFWEEARLSGSDTIISIEVQKEKNYIRFSIL